MKMIKREETKDDGRYIIFYEFEEEATDPEENNEKLNSKTPELDVKQNKAANFAEEEKNNV